LNQLANKLIDRLALKGLVPAIAPAFIRCVRNILLSDKHKLGLLEINMRLHALGWDTLELDEQTLELIKENLDNGNFVSN